MVSEKIKPLRLDGHAAEFKFESRFEGRGRLFQKVIEGLEGKSNGQALVVTLRRRSPAQLWRVGQADTNPVRFRVGGNRCWPLSARFTKSCCQSWQSLVILAQTAAQFDRQESFNGLQILGRKSAGRQFFFREKCIFQWK